jgi:hypothetical protein
MLLRFVILLIVGCLKLCLLARIIHMYIYSYLYIGVCVVGGGERGNDMHMHALNEFFFHKGFFFV